MHLSRRGTNVENRERRTSNGVQSSMFSVWSRGLMSARTWELFPNRWTLTVEDACSEARDCTAPLTLDPSPLRCRRSLHGRMRAGAREGTAAAIGSSHARFGGTAWGRLVAGRGGMGIAACSDQCAHVDWPAVLAGPASKRWTLRPSPDQPVAPVVVSSPLRHPGGQQAAGTAGERVPEGRVRGSMHRPDVEHARIPGRATDNPAGQ